VHLSQGPLARSLGQEGGKGRMHDHHRADEAVEASGAGDVSVSS
jgi:hypothetical protein